MVPSKITDRWVNCPVNVVLTAQVRVHKSLGIGTQAGELFPEGLEVVPEEMAEEASTGDLVDNQPLNVYKLYTKTTVMNLTTDYDEIERPAPRRVLVEVTEEASTDDTTIEKCMYEVLDKNETTDRKVSTELLEIPQQLVTRGFLELAEEARIVKVEKNQSFLVEEVLPQITVTRPMCEPVSWMIEEDLGQSVESLCEGTARVPTVRFDVGQLMQWPDINSAGVMICGFMLESEMPSLGSVRRAAEPVSVATKSEMLTPVFAGGGGVIAAAAPLVVVEAVTSRVSFLPVVGSDILTGLSVAAGGADQLLLGSGDIFDKVGHGAGRSGVRIVPVERLSRLGEVRNIVLSWMRPVAVLTSQFFLSDEGGDVEMPLHINDGRAVRQRKVDFNYVNIYPQMTEGIQGVGPTEDRWDGHRIMDIWCRLCKWMNTQKLDPKYGLWESSGHDNGKLCTETVPRPVQYPVGNSELSCSPCS